MNDVWSFDTSTEIWKEIPIEGWIPEARSKYCGTSDGESIIVYGGKGQNGLLDDLLIFNTFTRSWVAYETTEDSKPAARSGGCLGIYTPLIFIFGGTTRSGQTSDLWVYNLGTQLYEKLYSGDYSELPPTQYGSCEARKEGDDIFFYTMFGETLAETPQQVVYKFSYLNKIWQEVYNPVFEVKYTRSMAAVLLLNDRILVAGGQTWGLLARKEIRYLDMNTFTYHDLGTLPQAMFASSYVYFKRTLYIHGGGDSFPSVIRKGVSINSLYAVYLDKNCEGEMCNWPCSYGTYLNGDLCEICPKGSYSDELGSTECKPCPPGMYGRSEGASSLNMCYPCDEESYNPDPGKSTCLMCPVDKTCPIGSIQPMDWKLTIEFESDQPIVYQENKEATDTYIVLLTITFLLGMFALIVLVLLRKKLRIHLQNFDMYSTIHNYIINEPMFVRKNKLGGLFSLIFFIAALLFIFITVISFIADNIYEDKALVPLIILEQEYTKITASQIVISTTLENFGATCDDGDGNCASLLDVTSVNLKGSKYVKCNSNSKNDCFIEFKCTNCYLENSGMVQISSIERSSYTTNIKLNVTSSSSIPDESSSLSTFIEPSSTLVFIGNTPTVFSIQMTPSVFKSDVEEWNTDQTGYHVSQITTPEPGSLREASE